MNWIAEELDAKLNELDSAQANRLIMLVRHAIEQVEQTRDRDESVWPDGYFEQTAGSFAGEPLERAVQGDPTVRDIW